MSDKVPNYANEDCRVNTDDNAYISEIQLRGNQDLHNQNNLEIDYPERHHLDTVSKSQQIERASQPKQPSIQPIKAVQPIHHSQSFQQLQPHQQIKPQQQVQYQQPIQPYQTNQVQQQSNTQQYYQQPQVGYSPQHSMNQQQMYQQPMNQQQMNQQPVYQQPMNQQQMYQQPMYQQPMYQQSIYGGPTFINNYGYYPNACGHPVPKIDLGVAIACLLINIFIPGLGTMIAGCVPNENRVEFVSNCCCFFWLGVMHMTFTGLLFGWILAIIFGAQLITAANFTTEQFNSYNIVGVTNINQIPVSNVGVVQVRPMTTIVRM